jgi:hypothetical protein
MFDEYILGEGRRFMYVSIKKSLNKNIMHKATGLIVILRNTHIITIVHKKVFVNEPINRRII